LKKMTDLTKQVWISWDKINPLKFE
jgi:hypothetical protein